MTNLRLGYAKEGVPGGSGGAGAALFTQITAETEDWKTAEAPRKARKPLTAKQKQVFLYAVGAAAAIALVVALILFIQPVNRVIRAVNAGDYEHAREIYWNSGSLRSGSHDGEISNALLKAAEHVTSQYAGQEISGESAAAALSSLGGIGRNGEALLAASIGEFHTYTDSRDHMAEADRLTAAGEHLAAREEYLLVLEGDANYASAQEKARESLTLYADSVRGQADMLIQTGDYAGAILAMEAGKETLLGYEAFNEKLENKLEATYGLFEQGILRDAAALAAESDYDGAAALLQREMARCSYETEALKLAVADYTGKAVQDRMDGIAAQASELYEAQDAAGAFALLDTALTDPEILPETAQAAIEALEERFAADTIAAARAAFAMDRDSLPNAVAMLNDALRVRHLNAIAAYRTEISAYLPANLAEVEYTEKDGVIFRSAAAFEAVDGAVYEKGWLWGEDGAGLTFELNGGYDLVEGTFTVRRPDGNTACGWFEIICDGETVYTSPELRHESGDTIPFSVAVSGCQVMAIRFHNDYSVRTAEDGYCYHGICDVIMTKKIA